MAHQTNNNYARYPAYSFLEKSTKALRLAYAHTTIVSTLARDPRNPYKVVPLTSLQNYSQSVGSSRADNSGVFNATAVVGIDQIFRPYSMDVNQGNLYPYASMTGNVVLLGSGLPYLPTYAQPNSIVTFSGSVSVTSKTLNPFPSFSGTSYHDAEWISSGSSYSGLHTRKKYDDLATNARSIAIKYPTVFQGWGFNIAGNPIPHASGDISYELQSGPLYTYSSGSYPSGKVSGYNLHYSGNTFAPHAFEDSTLWKTGPIDLRWNDIKGTWGFPVMLKGKFDNIVPAATGIGIMTLWVKGQATSRKMWVGNCYSSAIPANVLCMCSLDALEDMWYVSSMDC